ncbi:MAG: hypothetical protein CMI16_01855 [Opitutaceae bacterium]|nr:hypothetical protein [Opitutaceae bacterium]
MSETPPSFSHLESPSPGSKLNGCQHMIRGWVWPQTGRHIVDVRARIGDQLFPGVHGIPRADLATHFKTGRPFALAEFYIVVDLPVGSPGVVLEHLDIEGHWTPFQTATYQIVDAETPEHVPTPSAPVRWHEYGRALQILLREQRAQTGQPLDALANELVARIPYPRDLRHPHLPFHGHLDEPAAITRCGFGRAAVLGYLFHESLPIKRVLATFDLQVWQAVDHAKSSPLVGEHFDQFTNAQNAGLFGIIDVPAQLPNPVCLRLYAQLEDGSLHLCSVAHSHLFTNEDEKRPYLPRDRCSFDDTIAALDQAFQKRNIEVVQDDELAAEKERVRKDFEFRAPSTLPDVAPLRTAPHQATTAFPERILLVTHNLNLEGAPLFLIDLANHYASLGAKLTIISPSDGPLRKRFEACGAVIQIVDTDAFFASKTRPAAQEALDLIGTDIDFTAHDLVVCNTFTTFWAVRLAKAAKRPVLLYVHESTTPASFYIGRVAPEVVAFADEAFALADAVSFTTISTRNYHLDYGRPEKHWLTPGWIDVARIDTWRTEHSRDALRADFKLQDNELLVTNVGSVCDRKGQHIFARAVDLLCHRYPELAARTKFIMLGGSDTPFDEVLTELLEQIDRPNLTVHPGTPDYFPYYAAADLFVCSTYEESSPRVILETMACQTPILSSGVHGVPEQARADLEAILIKPGDTVALCEGMAHLLLNPEIGRDIAARARARVLAEFEAGVLLPRHSALAAKVSTAKLES